MLQDVSSKGHMLREGEGAVVRQGRTIAVVVAFLIGCAVFLMAGASGVQAQASNKEEARCEGTRKINVNLKRALPRTTYLVAHRVACSKAPTKETSWPERKVMTRYAALAVKTSSWGALATTSSTAGRATMGI